MTNVGQTAAPRRISDGKAAVIFDATLALLAEVGFERLTVDGIAARAGVGKATIYRWWSGKAEVVVAALADRRVHTPVDADTGSLRGDLRVAVHDLIRVARSQRAVIMGIGATVADHPEIAYAVQEQILPVEQRRLEEIVGRARRRREISGDVPELVYELGPAVILGRVLYTGGLLDDAFVDALLDDVLLPLLTMRRRSRVKG